MNRRADAPDEINSATPATTNVAALSPDNADSYPGHAMLHTPAAIVEPATITCWPRPTSNNAMIPQQSASAM